MKKVLLSLFASILMVGITGFSGCRNTQKIDSMLLKPGDDYASDWQKVENLEQQGLTQDARKAVEEIARKAAADNNGAQVLKTRIYLYKYAERVEEDSEAQVVQELRGHIATDGEPLKSLDRSLLAGFLWQYYNQNQYKILNRTPLANSDGEADFAVWDAQRFSREITQLHLAAIKNAGLLQQIPVETFDAVVQQSDKLSRPLRPTLYDLLAWEALEYFQNDAANITKAAGQFQLNDPAAFADARSFANAAFSNTDELSLKFYALQTFQNLAAFHLNDDKPAALIDVERLRLKFARRVSVLPEKDKLYETALQKLQSKYAADPASTWATYELASYYDELGDKYSFDNEETHPYRGYKRRATQLCDQAIEKHPASHGASNCKILKNSIATPSFGFSMEQAVPPATDFNALVSYRNLEKVYGKIVPIDENTRKSLANLYNQEERIALLEKLKPIRTWEQSFSNTGDHQLHSAEMPLEGIENTGYHALILSTDPKFGYNKQAYSHQLFWVTKLSAIKSAETDGNEYHALDRSTGQPVAGADYEIHITKYDRKERKNITRLAASGKTGSNGTFKYKETYNSDGYPYGSLKIVLQYKGDRYDWEDGQSRYYGQDTSPHTQTHLFSDRSIYRPGQTVYYKGIMLSTDGKNPRILPGEQTTVTFYDANRQKIAETEHRTNEYGSFSGKFVIPTGSLNGSFRISNPNGSLSIQVEEYKRPKFEVKIEQPEGSYRLNETVKVKGNAKAYAGSNIDGAKVSYRVMRRAHFPYWWRPAPAAPEMEITNGTTKTDASGAFDVELELIPDQNLQSGLKPQFTYTVIADVTDINGETRSGQTNVSAGYVALLLNAQLGDEMDRTGSDTVRITSTNLAGKHEPTKVTVTVHRLKTPDRVFRQRHWQQPDTSLLNREAYYSRFPHDAYNNEDNAANWEKAEKVYEKTITTTADGSITLPDLAAWQTGKYTIELTAKDSYGEAAEWEKIFTLYDFNDDKVPSNELFWHKLSSTAAEPGQTITFAYGSAAPNVRLLLQVEHDNRIVQQQWLDADQEQRLHHIKVEEAWRGNFVLHLAMVKYNRALVARQLITVPWSNKELSIETQTFRSKLYPGQEEEWRLKISGPEGEKIAAEMLAGMYDASLDAIRPHSWNFHVWNSYYSRLNMSHDPGFGFASASVYEHNWHSYPYNSVHYSYDRLLDIPYFGGRGYYGYQPMMRGGAMNDAVLMEAAPAGRVMKQPMPAAPAMAYDMVGEMKMESDAVMVQTESDGNGEQTQAKPEGGENTEVQVRRNLEETAFFMPQLKTDAEGSIILAFKVPESLTRWKLMGLAHDKQLRHGQISEEVITQKDLMVMPNTPRFLRENDQIWLSAKVSNLSDRDLAGTAELHLFDARTMQPVDAEFGNGGKTVNFKAAAGQSAAAAWQLKIPEGAGAITWRIVARAGNFSDGEESTLPVVSNRMLVTESMPLPVRGKGKKEFTFENLGKAQQSGSLQHHRLTLEFTPQPAWYAVQALPYLMEFPHECTEQIFSRYYANSIAAHVANSSPKIKKVFEAWKNEALTASGEGGGTAAAGALLSNLEKNQELKAVLLEETPWVLDAKNESERKQRLAILFDLERMGREQKLVEKELKQRQMAGGAWPWFPGMRESRHITQHIVAGIGHLEKLGVSAAQEDPEIRSMLYKAVRYLDNEMRKEYDELKRRKADLNGNNIGYMQIQYLYARSFFPDFDMDKQNGEAFGYWKSQAAEHWLKQSKYMQGMIALALHRHTHGDSKTANGIMESLRQNATHNDEMGMYYKDNTGGWYWYQAPIETQALLIEAFHEVAGDQQAVEDMKVWLLKQKQTQDWKTTKATAEACYALLLQGTDWLASDESVVITVGSLRLDPKNMPELKAEAGTGYFKKSWQGNEITPDMANISIDKKDDGVAWGGVYWQYFEQLDKITPAETPLSIKKELFLQKNTSQGPQLTPISDGQKLEVGDLVKVRVEIRCDRLMEYVHLKDMRAAGFEPVNVISQYKYQNGLGYYESTKDVSTNFFMDVLPKGTYVFEYPLRVSHKGDFSNGITSMQCMYAPEFSSHSEGIRVVVE